MDHQIKILFLCPYPYDEVASQRFRFEQYYEILRKNHIQFLHKSFYSLWAYKVLYNDRKKFLKSIGTLYGFIKRFIHLFYCIFPDYIFIHREITPIGPPVFEWLIARFFRKKIIYDFDDAIWISNTSEENKLISKLKWHTKFFSICTWSYKISCCNEFLAENSRKYNQNISIIPTTIDTQKYSVENPKDKDVNRIIIGWTGTHSTLTYLSPLIDLIKQITEKYPMVIFRVICNKRPEWKFPNLQYVRWNKTTEIEDLRKIDIGLMPLPVTDWAKGKCGFKILQYFSMGIPTLASPVGINKDIITQGKNGYLCSNEKEWMEQINILVQSSELRKLVGNNGRKTVEQFYSRESNTKNFLGLFE